MSVDLAKARRETMRWTILLTLNNARPIGAREELVLSVVQGMFPDATAHELRRELDYLDDRKLVTVKQSPDGSWHVELARYGVDVAEYTVDCDPGIARPVKYW
ncbi:MAG: hypothetical protein HQL86_01965 [Magnetococcales bacterium]|nr:hypothetical protein [Magnetococcales bacterium]